MSNNPNQPQPSQNPRGNAPDIPEGDAIPIKEPNEGRALGRAQGRKARRDAAQLKNDFKGAAWNNLTAAQKVEKLKDGIALILAYIETIDA